MHEITFFCSRSNITYQSNEGAFTCSTFANGETTVVIEQSVRRHKCVIVQTLAAETVNDDIFEVLLIAEALRGAAADQIKLILLYLPNQRNDRLLPKMLEKAGINEVVTVDASSNISRSFDIPLTNISSNGLFAQWINNNINGPVLITCIGEDDAKTSKKLAETVNAGWTASLTDSIKTKSVIIYRNYFDNDNATEINGLASHISDTGAVNVYLIAAHACVDSHFDGNKLTRIITTNTVRRASEPSNLISLDVIPEVANCINELL